MFSKVKLCNVKCVRGVKIIPLRTYQTERVFGYRKKERKNTHAPKHIVENGNFFRWVTEYRKHAHKIADVNPVLFQKFETCPELDPKLYGLQENETVNFENVLYTKNSEGTVMDAQKFLQNVYTNQLSAEFSYLESEEQEWFAQQMEKTSSTITDNSKKVQIAQDLLKSQTFDQFLAKKYPGLKRYGGEGAESMMVFFREFLELSSKDSIEEIVIGIPHRGRLNLLTGILNFPPVKMFKKLGGYPDFPTKFFCSGDVLSHSISSTDLSMENRQLHISLLYNPSHLEVINPVSMGKTRSKQMRLKDGDYNPTEGKFSDKVLNIQVHGDAALSGQGVNQECLNMTNVPHFEIGGSIHLVVNNQVGFTTPSNQGRSSRYCTDLAKIISAPVLHVNGDHPEAVLKATKIAFDYQREFRKDVYVDLNCYRKWGHNELDDPTFTNPILYKIINNKKTVPDMYVEKLQSEEILTMEGAKKITDEYSEWLNQQLNSVDTYEIEDPCFKLQWEGIEQAQEFVTTWDTGVHQELLVTIGKKSVSYPSEFKINPRLETNHINARLSKIVHKNIDWATAEALAFGSLLYEGYNVRLSGQDVGRGTFSHRHVMLVDQETNETFIPLNSIHPQQTGFLEVANSILSELAVLGYEYGMSVDNPLNLIIWEAQFGDFFNGAQIIFDTFISSGEAKWLWSSGLVILLPHGYDGAGPEHSSARIERFLQLTDSKEYKVDGDNINMQVCQPSTPAQYFHLLRRQMVRNFRKPLVIIAPKTLLRLSSATSNLTDMVQGTTFLPVIGDTLFDNSMVKTVIFCSGKHFYNLFDKRREVKVDDVALVRLESLCPFPTMELQREMEKFPNASQFIWSQEEPRNMGAWSFIKPRFENLIGKKIIYCGRDPSAAPAVGVGKWHSQQAEDVINQPFLLAKGT